MSRAWPVDGLDPNAPLAENARRILAVKMAELYSYAPIVRQTEAIALHHDMRIAAKRLRYTLELFRAVFGEPGEGQIERVKAIQEALGDLHDLDVRIALIEDELRSLDDEAAVESERSASPDLAAPPAPDEARESPPTDPRRGLLALLARQRAARQTRHRAFVDLWERLQAEGMRAELAHMSHQPNLAESLA